MLSWNLPSACHQIKDANGSKSHNYFMSLRKKRHCQLYHDMILYYHINFKRHHNFRDVKMGKYRYLRINKMQYLPVASPIDTNWSFCHVKSQSNFLPYDSSSSIWKCSWPTWTFSLPALSPLAHKHDLKSMNHLHILSTISIVVYLDLYLLIHVSTKHFFQAPGAKMITKTGKRSTFSNSVDIQSGRRTRICKQWGLAKVLQVF